MKNIPRNFIDLISREILEDPYEFADVINKLAPYKYEIDPGSLLHQKPRTAIDMEDVQGESVRDTFKIVRKKDKPLFYIGLESVLCRDPYFSTSLMIHDGSAYEIQKLKIEKQKQRNRKQKEHLNLTGSEEPFSPVPDDNGLIWYDYVPVVSLVLYYGDEDWSGIQSINEELADNEWMDDLKTHLNNYKYRVINIAGLPREQIDSLSYDFFFIADFFKQIHENGVYKKPKHIYRKLNNPEATGKCLGMLTGNKRIIDFFNNYYDGEEDIDMDFIVQMLSDEERAEIAQKAEEDKKKAVEEAEEKAEEDKKKAVEEATEKAEEDKKKALEEATEKAEEEKKRAVEDAKKESMERLFIWMSKATEYLLAKNRSEDIPMLTTNSEFRNQLFKELNLG